MLLSNAVVLVLGALQPALSKPANRRQFYEAENRISEQAQIDGRTVISYYAPNPGCADGVRTWAGVWPASASNPYTADYKARLYVDIIDDDEIRVAAFNNAELGIGEFKAAFVCDDDKRQAWLVSENFKIDDATPAKNNSTCIYAGPEWDPGFMSVSCDEVENRFCFDCTVICAPCEYCKRQCGQANTGDDKQKA